MQEIYKKIWKGFGFVLFAALLLFPAASVRAESEKLCNEEEAKVPEGYVISEEETGEEITCMEVEGTCGDSASWILDNGVLTISGSGDMSDYSTSNDPGWYSDRLSVKSIVIEDGITSIGKMAFYNCTNLTDIRIADSVSALGEAAFYGCSSLENITLPVKITALPSGLFAECGNLRAITAEGVTKIANYAFQNTALTEFTIGSEVTSIGGYAFFATKIAAFQVEEGNEIFSAEEGVLFSDQGKTLFAYPAGASRTAYIVPEKVTKIATMAFARNQSLQSVSLGDTVTELGESAFQECYSLRSVVIPDSVTEVGYFTFFGCENLESVAFGGGLESTSYQMFEECSSLTDITFSRELRKLYARTFARCYSLSEVELPENIEEIGNGCFGECFALTSFTSKGLKAIPYQAFLNDRALSSVSLNEGVTSISRVSFYGCTVLEAITVPKTVTFIHPIAFPKATEITCLNPEMDAFGINGYRRLDEVAVSGTRKYGFAYEVLKIVNEKRAENGMGALIMDESLLETAMTRAAEISVLFAHTRPDSSSCFDLNQLMHAENVAAWQTSPAAAMDSWMNSDGHRENILTESFTTIGIGCFQIDGQYYWVQCFGENEASADCSQPADREVTEEIAIAMETFDEANNSTGIIWGEPESYQYEFGIAPDNQKMEENSSAELYAYIVNPGTNGKTKLTAAGVNWKSGDMDLVTVENGKLKSLSKSGQTTIDASTKEGYFQASAILSVGKEEEDPQEPSDPSEPQEPSDPSEPQEPSDPQEPSEPQVRISFEEPDREMVIKESIKLHVTVEPAGYAGDVTWKSSDSNVLRVDKDGTITALWPGQAQVTAELNGKTAVCTVKVYGTEKVYTDVQTTDWYYNYLNKAYIENLMSGYSNGQFGPADNITRGQFAIILYRYEGEPAVSFDAHTFPDVAGGLYYSDAIAWAKETGVVGGYSNGYFGPDDAMTREQFATMMYRYACYKGYDVNISGSQDTFYAFPDAGQVTAFAETAMQWAVNRGLISGDQGMLNPQGTANRAVTATIMNRFIDVYGR